MKISKLSVLDSNLSKKNKACEFRVRLFWTVLFFIWSDLNQYKRLEIFKKYLYVFY